MSKREAIGFLILVIAYQAPEGIGQRLLHSFALQAALLLLFFPIAFSIGRWLRGSAAGAYVHWGWNLANGLQDSVVSVTVQSPNGGRLISTAVHLVLPALIFAAVPEKSRSSARSSSFRSQRS